MSTTVLHMHHWRVPTLARRFRFVGLWDIDDVAATGELPALESELPSV